MREQKKSKPHVLFTHVKKIIKNIGLCVKKRPTPKNYITFPVA
jgi:hypothetical protein